MGVIDFTGMPKRNKAYAGANGKKISVLYEGGSILTFIYASDTIQIQK